jgi:hypothetical protein
MQFCGPEAPFGAESALTIAVGKNEEHALALGRMVDPVSALLLSQRLRSAANTGLRTIRSAHHDVERRPRWA